MAITVRTIKRVAYTTRRNNIYSINGKLFLADKNMIRYTNFVGDDIIELKFVCKLRKKDGKSNL